MFNTEVITMKPIKTLALVVLGVLAVAPSAHAQTDAQMIERALAAAPARGRDATGVIKWNADYTYTTLKESTNRLVCYDRSGEDGRPAFAVQCTSVGNLDRVAQSRRFGVEGGNPKAREELVMAAEKAGTRVKPEFGSVFISMNGPDQASARIHTTIAVPGATAESLGLPDNPRQGGAWLMNAGTTTAHIMTPGH
jgi:hypothetical protein